MPRRSPKSGILGVFFGNLTAKAMALAMAVALWLYAYSFSTIEPTNPLLIPADIRAPEGWSVASVSDHSVKLYAIYPRRFSTQVDQAYGSGLIRIGVPLKPDATVSELPKTIKLSSDLLEMPRGLGLRALRFDPPEVEVTLIKEMEGDVEVVPVVSAPPPGYEASDPVTLPKTVKVKGRKDVVAWLEQKGIKTERIDISSPPPQNAAEWPATAWARIPQDVRFEGQLLPIRSVDAVQVNVILTRTAITKTFDNVTIGRLIPAGFPYVAEIYGKHAIRVNVKGPPDVMENVTPQDISLYVDVTGLTPNELPANQPVQARVVKIAHADELTVTPADSADANCLVLVKAKPE